MSTINVLGISGSLRRASYNTRLLHAAQELLPEGMTLEIFERLGEIPLYNADDDQGAQPEPVVALKERIRAADALLIATPEYNYSIPGGLKNAIDWASRPPQEAVFSGKPVALMGASMGMSGTMRAQYHLRQICVFVNLLPLNKPEVFVAAAHTKFDGEGRLTDEPTRNVVRQQLEALAQWTRQLRGA